MCENSLFQTKWQVIRNRMIPEVNRSMQLLLVRVNLKYGQTHSNVIVNRSLVWHRENYRLSTGTRNLRLNTFIDALLLLSTFPRLDSTIT